MTTAIRHLKVLCIVAVLAGSSSAKASVVVTQVEERAFFSLWLFSDHIQQNIAHFQILNDHDVTAIPAFTADALAGVDIVYVSPSYDELQITTGEIDVLEAFVEGGGRLIIPGDYGMWAAEIVPIAARFGVTYGEDNLNGPQQSHVADCATPITRGPGGTVEVFGGSAVNIELSSTNDDFRVLSTWPGGAQALGYLPVGAGEVMFLTDFNTWDNDMIAQHDNQALWTNLFELPIQCPADFDFDGTVGPADLAQLLGNWGECAGCCPFDFNQDGNVGPFDLAILLGNWGPCE